MAANRHQFWRRGIAGLVAVVVMLTGDVGDARAQREIAVDQGAPVATTETRSVNDEFRGLVSKALHEDATVHAAAIHELRKLGPEAVNYLMSQPELRTSPRWSAVLDAVAQQKDAQYSGIFWHTDIEQALAVAKREKKPVLSLRLLGNLTDELSCANSRFFRTTLYPNPCVREVLANRFVLHWQSVRAVPIVTIDFGDGRRIQRTITGNSLHLVLDAQGRPIDVLPGLYAAGPFVRELLPSADAVAQLAGLDGKEFLQRRAGYHSDRSTLLQQTWDGYCQQANVGALPLGIDHQPDVWTKVALAAATEPVVDGEARRAVVERAPPAEVAGRRALTKSVSETPIMRLVRDVSRIINEDSVRNEYYLHATIHHWFAAERPVAVQPESQPGTPPSGVAVPDREALVARVYSELFLSPLNDPWYGLSKPDVYSAIANDGRIHAVTQNTGH